MCEVEGSRVNNLYSLLTLRMRGRSWNYSRGERILQGACSAQGISQQLWCTGEREELIRAIMLV